MPAARYWRAVGLESLDGGALELSELQLYDATGRVDAAATLTSTLPPTSGSLAALKDDNLATGAAFSAATLRSSGFALVWDFGAGVTKTITRLRLGSADSAATHPSFLRLEYLSATGWVADQEYLSGWMGARTLPDFTPQGYAKALIDLGSAVYYRMGSLTDVSGNSRHGTATGVITFGQAPLVGGSAASAYLRPGAGVDTADPFGTNYSGPWTAVVTAKPGTSDTLPLFGRGRNGDGAGWSIAASVAANGVVDLSVVVSSAAYSAASAAGVYTFGTSGRFVFTRNGGSIKIYLNGALVATGACPTAALRDSGTGLQLGKTNGVGSLGGGWFDEYAWFSRELSAAEILALDEKRNDDSGYEAGLQRLRTRAGTADVVTSMVVPQFQLTDTGAAHIVRDTEFGGTGRVRNTVKEKGAPDTPVRRRVRLVRERDGLVVREQWSDPGTGAYDFQFVDERQTYTVLSYDHTLDFRAVIADGLTLANGTVELMP